MQRSLVRLILAMQLAVTTAIVCLNGRSNGPTCTCDTGFHGVHCERTLHCNSFERTSNNSCVECVAGWKGPLCDEIDCGEHGSSTDSVRCTCTPPYSGVHCSRLNSTDVFSHYNHAMVDTIGPMGVLIIIPLIILLVGCNALDKKRSGQRLNTLLKHSNMQEIER